MLKKIWEWVQVKVFIFKLILTFVKTELSVPAFDVSVLDLVKTWVRSEETAVKYLDIFPPDSFFFSVLTSDGAVTEEVQPLECLFISLGAWRSRCARSHPIMGKKNNFICFAFKGPSTFSPFLPTQQSVQVYWLLSFCLSGFLLHC